MYMTDKRQCGSIEKKLDKIIRKKTDENSALQSLLENLENEKKANSEKENHSPEK